MKLAIGTALDICLPNGDVCLVVVGVSQLRWVYESPEGTTRGVAHSPTELANLYETVAGGAALHAEVRHL